MSSYWVYILRCLDGTYYTGVTNDIESRVWQHQEGLIPGCYTHARRPLELVYAEETDDIGGAIYREKQIKRWNRKNKEAPINNREDTLPELAKRQTPQKPSYQPKKYILSR